VFFLTLEENPGTGAVSINNTCEIINDNGTASTKDFRENHKILLKNKQLQ
jgi:hypothetical protein